MKMMMMIVNKMILIIRNFMNIYNHFIQISILIQLITKLNKGSVFFSRISL
jgi:hypothetical protein